MSKKLKRLYGRLCITIFAIGIFVTSLSYLMNLSPIVLIIGISLVFASLIIKYVLLVCPYCNYRGLYPQWSKNNSYCCPKCGKHVNWS